MKNDIHEQLLILQETGDLETDMSAITESLSKAVEKSTVKKEIIRNTQNEITPWINGNLRNLIQVKKQLLRKRKREPGNIETVKNLKRISRIIKNALRYSMNNYYENNVTEFQQNPKKCWNFLNKTLGRTTNKSMNINDVNGERILNDIQKADALNNFFLESVENLKAKITEFPGDTCNSLRTLLLHTQRFCFNHTTQDEIHHIISNLNPKKSSGHDCVSPKVLLTCVNDITPHLVKLFNNMIDNGIYPEILKIHKVVPIPKEVNATSLDKYRPIAVLSTLSNVFEKILCSQISEYMENQNLSNEFQYGFRKGCGTEEAVINVVNCICRGLDEGCSGVAGIFFDLSKAFDLIDHEILIKKLKYYGVWGKELALFNSYLTNRKQFVQINSFKSSLRLIKYGIPQGSVLGPLLFSIYLNDIKNLNFTGKLFIYADDICLFYPYKHELVAKTYMERDASLLFEFARLNKLVVNGSKTKIIRFKPNNNQSSEFSIYVNGEQIVEVNSIKYLGVYLQSNLTWSKHIRYLKMKTAQAIGLLYKFKNKFQHETKLLLYNALVQSHLNYLAIVYGYKNTSELKDLQRVQNKALKTVGNLPLRFSTISLYCDVFNSIFPIHALYKYQLLLYMFKCINNIGYHTLQFSINQHIYNTRNHRNLAIARCRLETTKQRIEYMGSREFNNLPENLKTITQISSFKRLIKDYVLSNIEQILT